MTLVFFNSVKYLTIGHSPVRRYPQPSPRPVAEWREVDIATEACAALRLSDCEPEIDQFEMLRFPVPATAGRHDRVVGLGVSNGIHVHIMTHPPLFALQAK